LGKGKAQAGIVTERGRLLLYDYKGEKVGDFRLPAGAEATPLVADVDRDGKLEIVIATDDQFLRCYDTDSTAKSIWGSFRANPYNTGVYKDPITDEIVEKEDVMLLYGSDSIIRQDVMQENQSIAHPFLIHENGIGPARLGITFGRLKKILGRNTEYRKEVLGIGLSATAVVQGREVQYYIISPTWKELSDTDTITMLGTFNTKYRTEEGIGPGAKIADAEKLFGTSQLTFRPRYLYQETIQFKNPSMPNLWFLAYSKERKGVYGELGAFNVTESYMKDSTIDWVGVKRKRFFKRNGEN
jgi:hypothetical protein